MYMCVCICISEFNLRVIYVFQRNIWYISLSMIKNTTVQKTYINAKLRYKLPWHSYALTFREKRQ